jgi:transcriptional activator of cad operon
MMPRWVSQWGGGTIRHARAPHPHPRSRMDTSKSTLLRIGDWCVDPNSGEISRDDVTVRLEARNMRLLLYLADQRGAVVSIEDVLKHVWAGLIVTSDSVYQAVAALRRDLGDDAKQPTYIETVPRRGYRMLATVADWTDAPPPAPRVGIASSAPEPDAPTAGTPRSTSRTRLWWGAAVAITLALLGSLVLRDGAPGSPPSVAVVPSVPELSVAVLPFLDLTESMDEEPFADGMTEELINRLSRVPGFRVPSLRSSLYFKEKQLSLAMMADSLRVAYVLDGSVRKAGARLRVAARLVRADNGYVAWTETYDRPFGDILKVQDEIAGKVTQQLTQSISPLE